MTCRDLSEFLQDYFADELPGHVASEFASHLGACDNCTVFIEQYRRTISAGRALLVEDEMAEVPEELVNAIVAALRASDSAG
jgi:anti-sigma factor RsiW